ncbi:MerR family transcriptional regulator [Pseudonocardia sp. HH130630-07]|uniref:MerR family transcriptional regulator n=1 Tax=Pseudonocardia sp. HH130630-07 TaxID=1690815 RepID=UPI000814EDFE|nr:MerR family transcriptional regulator [Pseudonocardia sp. HH130630-07]ANY06322.1 hypothetical protein AFB00_08460 [Pseudonocardia sp. HH130630-07]
MPRYRISQLAERVGVPATTLRYYGSRGLLPARRTPGGYRSYDDRDADRVRFIVVARDLGLSLDLIRDLLGVWEQRPCRDVRARLLPLVTEQLAAVDDRTAALRRFRDHLTGARDRLARLPDRDEPCDPACTFLATAPVPEPVPVACSLPAAEHVDRIGRWRTVLAGTTSHRLPGGTVRTELEHGRIAGVAALVADEVGCCPSLTFTLTVTRTGARLDATAPEHAGPLLDDLFAAGPTGGPPC